MEKKTCDHIGVSAYRTGTTLQLLLRLLLQAPIQRTSVSIAVALAVCCCCCCCSPAAGWRLYSASSEPAASQPLIIHGWFIASAGTGELWWVVRMTTPPPQVVVNWPDRTRCWSFELYITRPGRPPIDNCCPPSCCMTWWPRSLDVRILSSSSTSASVWPKILSVHAVRIKSHEDS